MLSKKVQLFCTGEGEHRRTFIQIPSALPFSRTDKIRTSTDTIRLSANSLIALADRIRKPADRIRKPTGKQSLFFTPRSQKNGKKTSFPQKSSRFQIFLNKKTAISIKFFQHLQPRSDFLLSKLNKFLSIFPNNYPKPKQEATEHSPSWGRWRGLLFPHRFPSKNFSAERGSAICVQLRRRMRKSSAGGSWRLPERA